jgi:hypothetical protein
MTIGTLTKIHRFLDSQSTYLRLYHVLVFTATLYTVFLVRMKVASRELPYSGCRVAVLDPKFAQESESGLKSAQSPAGKHENCMQSPVSWAVWPASRLAAGWRLAGSHASRGKSQSVSVNLYKKVDTGCMHALSRAGQPARILRFHMDCSDGAARSLGLRNFLLAGPGACTS